MSRTDNARVEANDRAVAKDVAGLVKDGFVKLGAEYGANLAEALNANAMHRARQSERRRQRRTRP